MEAKTGMSAIKLGLHKSALLAVALPPDVLAALKAAGERRSVWVVGADDQPLASKFLAEMRHPLGIVVADGLAADHRKILEAVAEKKGIVVRTCPAPSALDGMVAEVLDGLVPKRLAELASVAMERVIPTVFSGRSIKMVQLAKLSDTGFYDSVVVCETMLGDIVGQCTVRIASKKVDLAGDADVKALVSQAGEFTNQFLGIINYNLSKLGLQPKIGLPFFVDLGSGGHAATKLLIPSVYFRESQGLLSVEIGFINNSGGRNLEFGDIEFGWHSDEVQFL